MAASPDPAGLSVCVIGRNEAAHLERLAASLLPLQDCGMALERLFVDSASEDGSAALAKKLFDTVISLPRDADLCPGLARHCGTLHTEAEWVLYLDGDMAVHPGFPALLCAWLKAPREPEVAGLVGRCIDVYEEDEGAVGAPVMRVRKGQQTQFGGAVLLRRAAVLEAGNWDAGVHAWEELDLYVRLRGLGYEIQRVDEAMVWHYTERLPRPQRFIQNLLPLPSGLGKRFYGFGEILAAAARRGKPGELLRFHPYPFVWWAALGISAIAWLAHARLAALAALIAGVLYVWLRKGGTFLVLYSLLPVQAIAGFPRYRTLTPPAPEEVWTRRHGGGDGARPDA